MNELVIKKCKKCGTTIHMINKDSELICCNEIMENLNINENLKNIHTPNLIRKDKIVYITLDHEMKEEHYINKIFVEVDNQIIEYDFKPEDDIAFAVPYSGYMNVYSLCSKDGIWKNTIL